MSTTKASAASARSQTLPRHLELSGSGILFSKRLNPDKGRFPLFTERFKRKIGERASMTLSEAGAQAKKLADDLEHLQAVSLRDMAGRTNSPKDIERAIATWLWFVDWDAQAMNRLAQQKTAQALEADYSRAYLIDGIEELYGRIHPSQERYLTPLGDAMLTATREGEPVPGFSAAFDVWLTHTNRAHLDPKSRSYQDAKRPLDAFIAFAGDKPLAQITRREVERFLEARAQQGVRTTTVARELNALRAIWNRAANAADIQSRNPFESQPIKGRGTDAQVRPTPSAKVHSDLLRALNEDPERGYAEPLLAVLALTGMRLSEAWGLTPSDWDQEAGVLQIRPNDLRGLKTRNSERPLPVTPELAVWLQRLLSAKRASSRSSASALASKRLKTLLPGYCAHSLRHGFKQRLVEADAPMALIEELMGWSRQSMARHYGHLTITSQKRELVHKVYDLLQVGT